MSELVVIRIRGGFNMKTQVKDTLTDLRLHRVNYCVVLPDTPSNRGRLNKVKDYVTWGEVSDETKLSLQNKGDKPFFRLHPPIGGHARKGIKKAFQVGGALGNRKDGINTLIKRML